MSPIPVSRIQNVLGQGHEAIGLFTSTSYDPTLLDVETRDEAQVVTPKDQESQEIDMGSASGDTSPDANDSSPPFLDSERDRAEQEAQEAPATQSLWLPTRNIDSPISHGQGKSESLLDLKGATMGKTSGDLRRTKAYGPKSETRERRDLSSNPIKKSKKRSKLQRTKPQKRW